MRVLMLVKKISITYEIMRIICPPHQDAAKRFYYVPTKMQSPSCVADADI